MVPSSRDGTDANSVSSNRGDIGLSERSGVDVVELSVLGHSLISTFGIAALVKCGWETDLNSFSGVKPPPAGNTDGINSSADFSAADVAEFSVPGHSLSLTSGSATLVMCGEEIDLNSFSGVEALPAGNTDGITFSADSSADDVAEFSVPGHSLVSKFGAAKLIKSGEETTSNSFCAVEILLADNSDVA